MIYVPGEFSGFPTDADRAQIFKIVALAKDLEFAANHPAEIMDANTDAPILDQWMIGVRRTPCLIGRATGHPKLVGSFREIITSEVVLLAPNAGLARTRSRWYRLGRHADELLRESN